LYVKHQDTTISDTMQRATTKHNEMQQSLVPRDSVRHRRAVAKAIQLGMRIDEQLLAAIDAEAARITSLNPGVQVTRSDAARALILRGAAAPTSAPPAPAATHATSASAPTGPTLLARYQKARAERHTCSTIAKALECSEGTLRGWERRGGGEFAYAAQLGRWLSAHEY
jgi:hypothetical protein